VREILDLDLNFTGIGPKKCVLAVILQVFVRKFFLNLSFTGVCLEKF
jgi:hypothetical protein